MRSSSTGPRAGSMKNAFMPRNTPGIMELNQADVLGDQNGPLISESLSAGRESFEMKAINPVATGVEEEEVERVAELLLF